MTVSSSDTAHGGQTAQRRPERYGLGLAEGQVAGRVARDPEAADPEGGSGSDHLPVLDPERPGCVTQAAARLGHGVGEQFAPAAHPLVSDDKAMGVSRGKFAMLRGKPVQCR